MRGEKVTMEKEREIRRLVEQIPAEVLQQDLEKFRKRALELGATDAAIIRASEVIIDERARAKCLYPKCPWYGTNMNCPPYSPDLDFFRRVINSYEYGIFFRMRLSPQMLKKIPKGPGKLTKLSPALKQIEQIVNRIESEAFYDGYYFVMGFGGGSCKVTLCSQTECQALIKGQPCRHPLLARVSMEGAGMDAYKMAVKQGWDIYPIGSSVSPSEIPCYNRLRLVLIC
jgi:predicted metal-binding protein